MAWRAREEGAGGEKAVIELEGVLDSTNVEEFFGFINSVFKKGTNRMVLDLEFASYLSSGALSVIIDAYNRAEREGGKLVIARASEMIEELFEVVQFNRIIEFYDDLDDALDAL